MSLDKAKLIEDIKLTLGSDVVRLEIPDKTIDNCIDKAFREIKPYISDRRLITVQAASVVDLKDKDVLEVIQVYPASPSLLQLGGDNYGDSFFDFTIYKTGSISNLASYRNKLINGYRVDDLYIPFEFSQGKLYLSMQSIVGAVTLDAIVDVNPEDVEDERVVSWINKYSLALCKEILGNIRSKFTNSNTVPVTLDGKEMREEARSEKDKLEQALIDGDFGVSTILR